MRASFALVISQSVGIVNTFDFDSLAKAVSTYFRLFDIVRSENLDLYTVAFGGWKPSLITLLSRGESASKPGVQGPDSIASSNGITGKDSRSNEFAKKPQPN